MTITTGAPGGTKLLGPGGSWTAVSDLLALANPPYRWTFRFEAPDVTFSFTQTATTTTISEQARVIIQWQDLDTPAQLLADIHARLNDSIKVTTEVRDDQGAVLDGPLVEQVLWDPMAFLNANLAHWSQFVVSQVVAGGGSNDKLDQILAAVYRTWNA